MSNSKNMDLKGKRVIVDGQYLLDGKDKEFMCEDGFGCSPDTSGRKIYGKWLNYLDGFNFTTESGCINGEWVKEVIK